MVRRVYLTVATKAASRPKRRPFEDDDEDELDDTTGDDNQDDQPDEPDEPDEPGSSGDEAAAQDTPPEPDDNGEAGDAEPGEGRVGVDVTDDGEPMPEQGADHDDGEYPQPGRVGGDNDNEPQPNPRPTAPPTRDEQRVDAQGNPRPTQDQQPDQATDDADDEDQAVDEEPPETDQTDEAEVDGDPASPEEAFARFVGEDSSEAWLHKAEDGTLTGYVRAAGDDEPVVYTDPDQWAAQVDAQQMDRLDMGDDPGGGGFEMPSLFEDFGLKHLPGQHNQESHGNRYGSSGGPSSDDSDSSRSSSSKPRRRKLKVKPDPDAGPGKPKLKVKPDPDPGARPKSKGKMRVKPDSDDLGSLSYADLMSALDKAHSDSDSKRFARVEAELDRRDAARGGGDPWQQMRSEAGDDYPTAGTWWIETNDVLDNLVPDEERDAWEQSQILAELAGDSSGGKREVTRGAYDEWATVQMLRFEQQHGGEFFNRRYYREREAGKAPDLDGLHMFNGRAGRAQIRRYASEELLRWFGEADANKHLNFQEWKTVVGAATGDEREAAGRSTPYGLSEFEVGGTL